VELAERGRRAFAMFWAAGMSRRVIIAAIARPAALLFASEAVAQFVGMNLILALAVAALVGLAAVWMATVLTDGLPAVEAACAQAMSEGVHSSDVIINILARQRDPGPVAPIFTPDALRLRHAPVADCPRYDQLRRA
jgi:uncharacterized membrane protein YuzA (DUF378 family)